MQIDKKRAREKFDSLPKELRGLILSEETANEIAKVCTQNQVKTEHLSEIGSLTGYVLMGFLPPDKLAKSIAEKGIEKGEEIAAGLDQAIFQPAKDLLSPLYKPSDMIKEEKTTQENVPKKESSDPYRETAS